MSVILYIVLLMYFFAPTSFMLALNTYNPTTFPMNSNTFLIGFFITMGIGTILYAFRMIDRG